MSLPNATKTNYGNVDDVTPTEMNNVGNNLISLGQMIQKVMDDTWITTNANWNGTAWDRIDIAKAASAIKIGIDGSKDFLNATAGGNPIVWTQDRSIVQKVVDDTWITTNAYWNGTAWNRIDIAKAATALQIGIDGSKTGWSAAAGANPIVWVQGEKWDASGKLVAGIVPFSKIQQLQDSALVTAVPFTSSQVKEIMTISLGAASLNDFVIVTGSFIIAGLSAPSTIEISIDDAVATPAVVAFNGETSLTSMVRKLFPATIAEGYPVATMGPVTTAGNLDAVMEVETFGGSAGSISGSMRGFIFRG